MKMPRMNRKMVLEAPVRTPDGAGGFEITWEALGTVWADVRVGAGRERAGVAVSLAQVPCKIILRSAPMGDSMRPAPDQRFRAGSQVMVIQAVTEDHPAGKYLTCYAIEEVAA